MAVVPSIFLIRWKLTNKWSKQFLLCSNYPDIDMFRHLNAIFRGLHFPCKLLQFFSLRFGWMWAIVRSVWPFASECIPNSAANGHTEWTIAHIHPKRRLKNWSSLQGKCNPLKMAFGSRNMSGELNEHNKKLLWAFVGYFSPDYRKNARYNGQENSLLFRTD
jgi:hypothetical protein